MQGMGMKAGNLNIFHQYPSPKKKRAIKPTSDAPPLDVCAAAAHSDGYVRTHKEIKFQRYTKLE